VTGMIIRLIGLFFSRWRKNKIKSFGQYFQQRREKDDLSLSLSTPPPFLKWMQICLVQARRSIRKLLNVIFPLFLPFLFLDDDDVKLTWIKIRRRRICFLLFGECLKEIKEMDRPGAES
jgi:hypothetical protein